MKKLNKKDVKCKWCRWFRRRDGEDTISTKFVDISCPDSRGTESRRNIVSCQNPRCYVVKIRGIKCDPLNGTYVDYYLDRIEGHATLNAICECEYFKRTFVIPEWRMKVKSKYYLKHSVTDEDLKEHLSHFNEQKSQAVEL